MKKSRKLPVSVTGQKVDSDNNITEEIPQMDKFQSGSIVLWHLFRQNAGAEKERNQDEPDC